MIKPVLHQTITDAINHVFVEKHKYTFRGSSLPYCPVHDVVVRCQSKSKTLPSKNVNFEWRLAADIGTTIHHLLQSSLGERGRLLGNWLCKRCNNPYPFTVGPVHCKACGSMCQYEELEVRDIESGFSGHVDALIPHDNGFMLVDFKTIYRRKLSKITLDHKHRLQVFAYKYLLQRPPYNLNIVGQAVIYFAREDVSAFEIIEMEHDDLSEAEFVRYTRQKAAADRAMQSGDIAGLVGLCTNKSDNPYCPYNPICFGPSRTQNLQQVWHIYQSQS